MSFEEPNNPRSSEIVNNQIQLTELATYEERTPVLQMMTSPIAGFGGFCQVNLTFGYKFVPEIWLNRYTHMCVCLCVCVCVMCGMKFTVFLRGGESRAR